MISIYNHQHQQQYTNEHVQQSCCCCCCYCCCYTNKQQQQQNSSSSNQNIIQQQIPPWLPSSPNAIKPMIDSICSCCSCISNEHEEEISTRCTTPIDLKLSTTAADNIEKLRKKKLHAIEELLQTERDYVQDLSYLVQVRKRYAMNIYICFVYMIYCRFV